MKSDTSRNTDGPDTQVERLITLKQASDWATHFLDREVSKSNISYLIQYGKIRKYNGTKNAVLLDLSDLKRYYQSYSGHREDTFKKQLGGDLNWALSFDNLREKDTTKHVQRLRGGVAWDSVRCVTT